MYSILTGSKGLLWIKVKGMRRTKKNFFKVGDVCCYCDRPFGKGLEFTKEHIVPVSKGGSNKLSNLTPCCFECNQLRSNLDIKQFKTTVWNIIKILNGKVSLELDDLETIFDNLYNEEARDT
jgi:5-methylcytosine-specific restriction endonuclease McrA